MGAVTDFIGRVGHGFGQVVKAFGDFPLHCHRCRKASTLGAGELHPVYDVPRYANGFYLFCDECKQALYAEYRFHCDWCGKRHNLTNFPICADCQAQQYPREAKRVESQNARALEAGLEATLTVPEWLTTLNDWNWSCCWCGQPFEALDHLTPIARGGGTTAENCFPICRRCNSMKGAFLPGELLQPSPRSLEPHLRLDDYRRRRWPSHVADPTQGADEAL